MYIQNIILLTNDHTFTILNTTYFNKQNYENARPWTLYSYEMITQMRTCAR